MAAGTRYRIAASLGDVDGTGCVVVRPSVSFGSRCGKSGLCAATNIVLTTDGDIRGRIHSDVSGGTLGASRIGSAGDAVRAWSVDGYTVGGVICVPKVLIGTFSQ